MITNHYKSPILIESYFIDVIWFLRKYSLENSKSSSTFQQFSYKIFTSRKLCHNKVNMTSVPPFHPIIIIMRCKCMKALPTEQIWRPSKRLERCLSYIRINSESRSTKSLSTTKSLLRFLRKKIIYCFSFLSDCAIFFPPLWANVLCSSIQ